MQSKLKHLIYSDKTAMRISFMITVVFIAVISKNIIEGYQSMSWPFVIGEIVDSKIESKSGSNGKLTQNYYLANVKYNYKVGDNLYTGSRVTLNDYYGGNVNYSEKIIKKYYLNRPVDVYYNSATPEISVLEPGINFKTFVPSFAWYAGSLITFFILIYFGRWALNDT